MNTNHPRRRELDQLQNINTKVVISAATEGIPLYSYANPNLFGDVHIHFTLQ
jgi:hypothetical protein